jgi:hypothetical protein
MNDELISSKIQQLFTNTKATNELCDNNDKIIKKLILPTLELISNFLSHLNVKSTGNFDPDFKSQIEIKRTLIDQIISGTKNNL